MDQLSILLDERLTARQWSEICGCTSKAITKFSRMSGEIPRSALSPDNRETLNTLMVQHSATSCRALHSIVSRRSEFTPKKHFMEMRPDSRKRAELIRDIMVSHYALLANGMGRVAARQQTRLLWGKVFGKPCTPRTLFTWEQLVESRGGIEGAPLEAFADGRNGAVKERKSFPPDFEKWFVAQFLDSARGVPSLGNIYNDCESLWLRREEIPGLGVREGQEPFPYTKGQLHKLMPGRASREVAGRGKFLAKVKGYMAKTPLDWSQVEPVRVVYFDDKTLDCHVLTDDGRKSFRPQIYIAYCGATRRVLSFIAREEGRMTQLDVEGLQAAVLRDHGLGGAEAGFITQWVKERGTVSISDARKEFLTRLFAGRLEIHRTMMLGGKSAPGDWVQKGSGNFFGKAVLEAFMGSLDHMAKSIPGQSGHLYTVQPATLGDTTLTLEKLINSARAGHKPARSLIEEGILTAAMARVLDYIESGENVNAWQASQRTGIRPPLMYFSDFLAALGELFRAFNNRRGHRMQGFLKVPTDHPNNGTTLWVTESPNDKAARMFEVMRSQGRHLVTPHEADIAAMLHKVKRVTLSASGCSTEGLRYWHPMSNAIREAAAIAGGKKTFLALYNPVSPAALYLLANPPSHLHASATEIPRDFAPQLLEVLPLYDAPSPVDKAALVRRSENVAAFNARTSREVIVHGEAILQARGEERQALKDRLEPLRATLRSAAPPVAPEGLPPSGIATSLAEAEALVRSQIEPTRAAQRAESEQSFAQTLPLNETSEY